MAPYELRWAKVAFEDNPTESKWRPVLIVEDRYYLIYALKVTSHPPREKFWGEYEIKRWRDAGLTEASTIRISQFLELAPEDIGEKIGDLHTVDILTVENYIERLYG